MIKREVSIQKKLINQDNRITALKKQMVFYKEITETVREPFIILDNNLCVVTANAAFYNVFKVKKKDTEGKLIYDLGNKQWDILSLKNMLEKILPTHGVLSNYAVTHDFPLLGKKTILLNARQVDAKQLILLAMEDVTAKWKLKLDTEEMTKNLIEQRNRLQGLSDAKDEFISLASHQLRTPATVVNQYIAMLNQGYAGELTEDQLKFLDVAYKSNERQLEIIEDLLRVARVDAGKVYLDKSSSDIVALVEKAVKGQAVLFKKRKQKVTFNKPQKKVIASIDPKLILMVIENILDNAGKYSNDGQTVTISVSQNKTSTIVSIKDRGIGISESDQNNLFHKFYRVNNSSSVTVNGTGLGLYWTRKILDLHNGNIEVTSKANAGSTFKVCIPNDNSSSSTS